MNSTKVVIGEVQRGGSAKILDLLAERIGSRMQDGFTASRVSLSVVCAASEVSRCASEIRLPRL